MFVAADACPHVQFACITDRGCGAERESLRIGLRHRRIETPSNERFSIEAASTIDHWGGADLVMLLYGRTVTAPLVGRYPLLNVHPSLLPAFPGLGAVAAARAARAPEYGATLHGVTDDVDGGPIVAQVRSPLDPDAPLEDLQHGSFVQKSYLFFLAIDLFERGRLRFRDGLPALDGTATLQNERYLATMRALEREAGASSR